jgi:FkbH-like protein
MLEALRRVRMGMLQLHRMQEMPYYHLVQLMRRDGAIGGNTLYQAGFTFEHPMRLHLEGLRVEPKYIHPEGAQLDLFATFWQKTDSIMGVIKYDSDLFDALTVEHIGNALTDIANVICEQPQKTVDNITLIPEKGLDSDKKNIAADQPVASTSSAPSTGKPIVAVVASFTAEFLQEFMEFWFQKLGWRSEVSFAPFNQVFQELLNPSSLLRSNRRGHNVIMVRIEDLIDKKASSSWDEEETVNRISSALDELREAVATGAKNMTVPLCFVLSPPSPRGKELEKLAGEVVGLFLEALRAIPGVTVLTHEETNRWYPVDDYYEPLGETIGFIPFTRHYLVALSTALMRSLNTLSLKPVKALVVDCDGTLWQGVVGEDGPTGVIIGQWQRAFQEFLLKQYQAGVILCLCSKNQEADVWSVFEQNPGMLLKREHISFWKINWEAKSANLHALVKEMNIGIDAVAFLDDNPLERAEVGLRFPSVFCAEFPHAWEERTEWLEHCWLLDHPRATAEDKKRQEHYRSEQIRESLKQNAGTLSEFLAKLELKVDLNPAEPADYDRLAQLSVRTNQFNTTTLRLTTQQVVEYATTPGMSAHIARVRDRFGDYGLVGAMLARETENTYRIDCMFLSCRALGRSVEYRMASYLATKAKQAGCIEIEFPLKTTERNEPARNFLTQLNKLCNGIRDKENGVHINADNLVEFNYETIPRVEESAESSAPEKTQDASGDFSLQDREPFIHIAGKLDSVTSILNAVEQIKQETQRKNAATRTMMLTSVPETETERLIADVWKQILGLSQVNTHAKFFEVGGTSLLMVRVAIELKRGHGIEVSIANLFQYPTICELAQFLDGKTTGSDASLQEAAKATAIRQKEALKTRQLPNAFKRLKETRK